MSDDLLELGSTFAKLRAQGVERSTRVRMAAEGLLARGQRPTVRAIRNVLGGGSLSDINRDLRELREASGPTPSTATVPAIESLDVGAIANAVAERLAQAPAAHVAESPEPTDEFRRLADAIEGQMRFVIRQVDDTRMGERLLRDEIVSLKQRLTDENQMAVSLRQANGNLRNEVASLRLKLQQYEQTDGVRGGAPHEG